MNDKTFTPRSQPRRRRKNRRDLVSAVIVGLILSAILGYMFYESSLKHHFSN
jgi:multisubunit Na+/H+ antiporter MnhB subunit